MLITLNDIFTFIKTTNIPFPRSLVNNVFIIIITQTPGKFFVIHFWLVFSHTPSSSNLLLEMIRRIDQMKRVHLLINKHIAIMYRIKIFIYLIWLVQFELPLFSSPRNDLLTGTIGKQLKKKLPQLYWTTSLVVG